MALSERKGELDDPDIASDDAGPGAIGGVAFVAAMSGVAFAGMTTLGAGTLAALLAAPWLGACLGIGVLAARSIRLGAPPLTAGDRDGLAKRVSRQPAQ